ncbi:hypothetical protein OG455_03100 [Kitasatospora sp. NBC_01287]|uniref:hypothetical protein n=1 Tax=Kitasatospora sp. NBC_01287 TaxID=2903573 RepID=UPI00224CFF95|nr:hypothetical protein [Kitasatospora sp. NBC_01287]MCX4744515.1 hypothetical protein [Kitasatospora sp. NBC_01287]
MRHTNREEHLHVHVVPRNRKDGLRGFFWPRGRYADDTEARRTAELIQARAAALLDDPGTDPFG